MRSLVLTAIGPDRAGLVEELAAVVAEHGGNWLESRMARLGGEFAGIVRVEIAEGKSETLRSALSSIGGLTVIVSAAADAAPAEGGDTGTVQLELLGSDRPGIVSAIARALAARGVNVENLDTERTSAPMSGEVLFKASAQLLLPPDLELADLQADLEELAGDLMVDLTLGNER